MVLASQQKNARKGAELVQDRVPMVMVSVVLVNHSLDCCLFSNGIKLNGKCHCLKEFFLHQNLSKKGAFQSKLSLLHKNGMKNS